MFRIRHTPLLAITLSITFMVRASAQQIAFTWDDLPAHSTLPPRQTRQEIAADIISAMKTANMPAAFGFVNGVLTEKEPLSASVLRDCRNAGLPLGNHTWSHMNLNQNSLADWEADVVKNEPMLRSYMGSQNFHWLRFPFLAEGDTPEKRQGARKFLAQHGYKIAGVTMSFGDYLISLEDAEKDPFYKEDTDLSLPPGPDTLEEALGQRNLPIPKRPPLNIDLNDICR